MTDPAQGDQDVWLAARAGDGRAFAVLFDRYHARVHRHAQRHLADPHDAEEVMAAAFFELWRKRSTVHPVHGSVLPWLLVTAANLARNRQRALRRYRALLDSMPRTPEHSDPEPSDDAVLGEALRRLKPVDAELLVLTAIEGFGVAEAAAAVRLTPGAARVRLHRARARLRGWLTAPSASAHLSEEVS